MLGQKYMQSKHLSKEVSNLGALLVQIPKKALSRVSFENWLQFSQLSNQHDLLT